MVLEFARHKALTENTIDETAGARSTILGHQSIQMTMRYAHLAPEAFGAVFDRFGTEALVGPPAVVIELPQAVQ